MSALMVTLMYLVTLLIALPFKRSDINWLATVGTQFMLFVVFFGALLLKSWSFLETVGGEELAMQLFDDFESSFQMVCIIGIINFVVVAIFVVLTLYQSVTRQRMGGARLTRTKRPPELVLGPKMLYHVFISHMSEPEKSNLHPVWELSN